jgi:hypothetical protein
MKGKYATKAINRAAATDNEVIAQLRLSLAEVRQEKTQLLVELNTAKAKLSSEVHRLVAQSVSNELESLAAEREKLQSKTKADKREAAELLMKFIADWIQRLEKRFGDDGALLPSHLFGGSSANGYRAPWDLISILELLDNKNGGALLADLFDEICHDDSYKHRRNARRRSARRVASDMNLKAGSLVKRTEGLLMRLSNNFEADLSVVNK